MFGSKIISIGTCVLKENKKIRYYYEYLISKVYLLYVQSSQKFRNRNKSRECLNVAWICIRNNESNTHE